MKSRRIKNLVIFNLETNLRNPILATTHLWIEGFAQIVPKVSVYSVHVGNTYLPENCTIKELGGGNWKSRIIAIFKLVLITFKVCLKRRNTMVFHHQIPTTTVFPGIVFRLLRIRQALWYSHSSRPLSLKIGSFLVKEIVTSTFGSFPLAIPGINYVGHGVYVPKSIKIEVRDNNSITFLGRISTIKNLDRVIDAVKQLSRQDISINFTGPVNPSDPYSSELIEFAKASNVNLQLSEPIDHSEIQKHFEKFGVFFSGMENSVDKSAIEAAIFGCFVLTTDQGTQELTGMNTIWREVNGCLCKNLPGQITYLTNLNQEKIHELRDRISNIASLKNNYLETTSKIVQILSR
jgi:glycosyltransferase involved in cell wall biosynthesis